MKSIDWKCVCLCAVLLVGPAAIGKVIYVDAGATGANTGANWTDAYVYLQDALGEAVANDEIRVAQGSYRPDQGAGYTPGDRQASFVLKNAVTLLGGYPSGGGDRDSEANPTILTGDLTGNDDPERAVANLRTDSTRDENSYHVIFSNACGPLTVLDGFIVTGGHADGNDAQANGGGWYNAVNSSPTVTNCDFYRNSANQDGGGFYNKDAASKPVVTQCRFRSNNARDGGGIYSESNTFAWVISDCQISDNVAQFGGGMQMLFSSSIVERCVFTANVASSTGGALYFNSNSNPQVRDCEFIGNSSAFAGAVRNDCGRVISEGDVPVLERCRFEANTASSDGGAIYSDDSDLRVMDGVFLDNVARRYAGAVYNRFSDSEFIDCRFLSNTAENGDGGAVRNISNSPKFFNCLFSYNEALDSSGGAVSNRNYGSAFRTASEFRNCTFWWNLAKVDAGGIFNTSDNMDVVVSNSILWENLDDDLSVQNESSQITGGGLSINYSCVMDWSGAYGGEGNIGQNPLFVDPAGPDFLPGNLDDNLRLAAGSPAIDAGSNLLAPAGLTQDLDGGPRFVDDPAAPDTGVAAEPGDPIIDMGAYESNAGCVPQFADAQLKTAVEAALGVTDPTCDDMLELITLDVSGQGISDLTGLEHALNLERLTLTSNQIADITPLAGLINLDYLHLAGNQLGGDTPEETLANLAPLCTLSNLRVLVLSSNEIQVIPDLCCLTGLEYLYLYSNDITDLCPLTCFTSLRSLRVYSNPLLTLESYQTCIPQIKANNPNLTEFTYDYGCTPALTGDLNNDCIIDLADVAALAANWLECTHIYEELCP